MRIVIGITGSSGAVYARDFIERCEGDKFLVVSKWGKILLKDELGIGNKDLAHYVRKEFSDDDLCCAVCRASAQRIDA